MLTIRAAQMAAFERACWRDFVDRVEAHVGGNFPERAVSGEPGLLRTRIEQALTRGRVYGLESEYELLQYVHLSFALGSEFDRDARYPWAGEILGSNRYGPRTKIDLLTQLAARERGAAPEPDLPTRYDDEQEEPEVAEPPDEEILPLDDEVPDFEPESEEPGELPEDVIPVDDEDAAREPAAVPEAEED